MQLNKYCASPWSLHDAGSFPHCLCWSFPLQVLATIRRNRINVLGVAGGETTAGPSSSPESRLLSIDYAEMRKVQEELEWAKELYCSNPSWAVLDVTLRCVGMMGRAGVCSCNVNEPRLIDLILKIYPHLIFFPSEPSLNPGEWKNRLRGF